MGALAAGVLAGLLTAHAAEPSLDIVDRVSTFQSFYAKATAKPLDSYARWELWKKEYGIAAVPPGPEGDAMARPLVDGAWTRYPALMPRLGGLFREAGADAREAFGRINALFGSGAAAIHSRLVLYVGQFDNNAYTVPAMDGQPVTVMMPVENVQLRLSLAHELTHSVHIQLASVHNSFGAPIGETMFLEGLAMRTAQKIYPGKPETAYTQMDTAGDWLAGCYRKQDAVLAGIVGDLDKSGRDIAMKYTFGQGHTGMQREVYCAAWIVMGRLLSSGRAFPQLARIPESQMIVTMRDAMKLKR